eukprot:scaffold41979_cov64-Phaeocystis_antarctica.AAC.7
MRGDLAGHARLERRGELGEQLCLHPLPRHRLLQHSACGRVALGLLLQLRELLVSLARRRELVLLEHEVRLLPLHLPGLLLMRASQRREGGAQLGGGVALRVEPPLQQCDRRVLLVAQRALQHALVRPVLVGLRFAVAQRSAYLAQRRGDHVALLLDLLEQPRPEDVLLLCLRVHNAAHFVRRLRPRRKLLAERRDVRRDAVAPLDRG